MVGLATLRELNSISESVLFFVCVIVGFVLLLLLAVYSFLRRTIVSSHVLSLLLVICLLNEQKLRIIMLGVTAQRRASSAFLSTTQTMHPRTNSVSDHLSDSFPLVYETYSITSPCRLSCYL